jgi:hypothetical protein
MKPMSDQTRLERRAGQRRVSIDMAEGLVKLYSEEMGVVCTLDTHDEDYRKWIVRTDLPRAQGYTCKFIDFPTEELYAMIMLLGGDPWQHRKVR